MYLGHELKQSLKLMNIFGILKFCFCLIDTSHLGFCHNRSEDLIKEGKIVITCMNIKFSPYRQGTLIFSITWSSQQMLLWESNCF
jgi:hypothetical protein